MIAIIATILVFAILALVIFDFIMDVINDRKIDKQIRQLKNKIRDLETDVKEIKENEVLN